MIKGFSSAPAPAKGAAMDTLIGRQTEINGDVSFSGGLHIEGRIKGNVTAASDKASTLSVAEAGIVEGNVRVANIVVNGRIVGDVHASERLTLGSKAKVIGNVHYRILQMEAGALVNGQLVYEGAEAVGALAQPKNVSAIDAKLQQAA